MGELSGGERRRLALMRLLMRGPNVLLLDEPTNDLDVDTLTALEDLLDGWPGTLVVVSHDRYFVERVCDNVHAITEAGGIRHLPGGIDQYIQERHADSPADAPGASRGPAGRPPERRSGRPARMPSAQSASSGSWSGRSSGSRSERRLWPSGCRRSRPTTPVSPSSSPSSRMSVGEREGLETSWLERTEALEG